jgi:hypothetical protein
MPIVIMTHTCVSGENIVKKTELVEQIYVATILKGSKKGEIIYFACCETKIS